MTADAIVAPTPLALRGSLADCWLLDHASRGHAGWPAAAIGKEAGDVGTGAQGPKTPGTRRPPPTPRPRESNGVLTRAVEGDGMRVRSDTGSRPGRERV